MDQGYPVSPSSSMKSTGGSQPLLEAAPSPPSPPSLAPSLPDTLPGVTPSLLPQLQALASRLANTAMRAQQVSIPPTTTTAPTPPGYVRDVRSMMHFL